MSSSKKTSKEGAQSVEEIVDQAVSHYTRGEYAACTGALEIALERDPDHQRALDYQARTAKLFTALSQAANDFGAGNLDQCDLSLDAVLVLNSADARAIALREAVAKKRAAAQPKAPITPPAQDPDPAENTIPPPQNENRRSARWPLLLLLLPVIIGGGFWFLRAHNPVRPADEPPPKKRQIGASSHSDPSMETRPLRTLRKNPAAQREALNEAPTASKTPPQAVSAPEKYSRRRHRGLAPAHPKRSTRALKINSRIRRNRRSAARSKARPNRMQNGTLSITGSPLHASVSIDRIARGTIPLRAVPLSAGSHRIAVRARGYQSREYGLIVDSGRHRTLQVALSPTSVEMVQHAAPIVSNTASAKRKKSPPNAHVPPKGPSEKATSRQPAPPRKARRTGRAQKTKISTLDDDESASDIPRPLPAQQPEAKPYRMKLPRSVSLYTAGSLKRRLGQVEAESARASGKPTRGLTLRLQSYLVDVSLARGDEVTLYPAAYAKIIVDALKAGTNSAKITERLLSFHRSRE